MPPGSPTRPIARAARRRNAGANGDPAAQTPPEWRPFQLAFILLNLAGLIDRKHPDRETADLLLDRYQGAASKMAYIGKHGWNTFQLNGTIPPDEIKDLIDTSYDLIVAKLPKSKRPA